MAVHQVLAAGPLSTRIYVPQSVFVVAGIGAGLVNLVLTLLPLLLVMLFTGVSLQLSLLWLPLPLFVLTVFALGMALLVASLAVSFSDLVELYQVVLSIWYFLSPIIYLWARCPSRSAPGWS